MASAYSPLLREQRNQFLMNGALIVTALVGGAAVTNERGLFVPVGIHNAISATAEAFAAIATPEGLRRLMTNSSPFGVPGETATPLSRLTIASGVPFPGAEQETMAWMPQEASPGDTAERLAGADFPTVTNGELLAANTPVDADGAPAPGGAGAGGDAGGGAGQPVLTAANDVPAAQTSPTSPFTPITNPTSLPLPFLIASNSGNDLAVCTRRTASGAVEADPACMASAGAGGTTATTPPAGGGTSSGGTTTGGSATTGGAGGGTTGGGSGGGGTGSGGGTGGGGGPITQAGSSTPPVPVPGAVPEPAAWAMLIGGFGLLGLVQRAAATRRRRVAEDAEMAALFAADDARAAR